MISEFMALNDSTLADEDGDDSDWIEIHNPTDQSAVLDGWYLTDDAAELTKWSFPDHTVDAELTLGPGEYLLVFASAKNRSDPAGPLHTSFKLDGDGEYLALVRPDGLTVAQEFAPEFPQQFEDVSYGLTQEDPRFALPDGSQVTYLVPTAAEASLGASWAAADFDDSTWGRFAQPSRVVITEAGTRSPDWAEIQNVSDRPIDTSGWVVAANDAGEGINAVHSTFWALPDVLLAEEVLYRTDDADDNYWGQGISWKTHGNGWLMIVDGQGQVADLVVWGYEAEEIATLQVNVNGFDVAADKVWSGVAAAANTTSSHTLQRRGESDHDDASDWAFAPGASMGEVNPQLRAPFAAEVATAVGFSAAPSELEDAFQIDVQTAMHDVNASLWVRFPVAVEDPAALETLKLRVQYNDGFVAYINGREVARRNAPALTQWDSRATAARSVEETLPIEEIDVTEFLDTLRPGINVLALHGLNVGPSDGDFLLSAELAGAKLRYFTQPTPGALNAPGVLGLVGDTKFSVDRGFYDGPVQVAITSGTPDVTIRYTTDGGSPTETAGTLYTGPITVGQTTALRAAAFKPGFAPSNVDTHTYLIDENDALKSLPVISLVADRDGTFGTRDGLWDDVMLRGREAEFPVSFEVINAQDGSSVQQDAGIRLHGSSYRRRTIGPNPNAKWSFKVYFRREYDDQNWLTYPLIERSSVQRYKNLTLRGGYNDPTNPFIKDELGRRLHQDMGSVASLGSVANLLINGRLNGNGYYNPVERQNERMLQEKLGSELPWDVVSKWQPSGQAADPLRTHNEPYYFDVRDGDAVHFGELLRYAITNDLSQDVHYRETANRLDVPQFVDYLILQGYARIRDWPQNNWNAARERSQGELGKWRFYAWDLEFGWGSQELNQSFKTPGSSNTMPISILYENLLDNDDFRQLFADRAQKHFFNRGALTAENVIARFEELRQEMSGVLPNMNAYIRDTWAERRPGVVLDSMKSQGLFTFEGPRFHVNDAPQHGGDVAAGDGLTMTDPSDSGTIYFTLDGSDPRLPGGGLAPGAREFSGTPIVLTESALLGSRTRSGNTWSALNEAWFRVEPPPAVATVAGRYVFYNHSAYGDEAVAADKEALRPGQAATFANYTSYSRGINGVLIDVTGLAGVPTAADFEFRVGNDDQPEGWNDAPQPEHIVVRPGEGIDGSDRIEIIWADGAVRNQWLQVTLRATEITALDEDDVFYFGNAVGEAGNSTLNAIVNATDEIVARDFQHGPTNLAAIDDPYDYNRDRLVNATDRMIARNHQTGPADMLRLISVRHSDALGQQAAVDELFATSGQ